MGDDVDGSTGGRGVDRLCPSRGEPNLVFDRLCGFRYMVGGNSLMLVASRNAGFVHMKVLNRAIRRISRVGGSGRRCTIYSCARGEGIG